MSIRAGGIVGAGGLTVMLHAGRSPVSHQGYGLILNGLGFAAGVGLFHLFADPPPLWALPALAALLGAAGWRWGLLRPAALCAAGAAWAQLHACQVLCDPFPERYTRQVLELVGTVASLPEDTAQARRFLFRIEQASDDGEDIGFRGLVRLSWYRDAPPLLAGERWRLTARLKPPHGFANPGGFDFERWLFVQGVRATGNVRASAANLRLAAGPGAYLVERWRQRLRDHIAAILDSPIGKGLVQALVLGDGSGLTRAQWDVLNRTGTSHLLAISGQNVGLVAAFVFFLTRWAWSRGARLTMTVAAPRAAAVAGFIGALAYSGLAGFAVSTQRAMVMLAVLLGAVLWSRTPRPASGLILALVGVLVLDPQAVLSFGFWLSFGAVGVLLYALDRRLPATGLWSRWGKAQWAVALGLLPMLLLLFGRASVIAPPVNLIAVPLFGLVLLPGVLVTALASLVPGLELPLVLAARVLEWGFGRLEAAAAWPGSVAAVSGRPAWVWAAAFAAALLLLAPRGLPGRWLGLVLLLPLPLVRPPVPAEGEASFTLLDVGQGLSAVVRTRQHTLVYDAGPAPSIGFDAGTAVVLPFLHEIGVERIDTLILSHADADHAGGYAGLAGNIPIETLLSGEPDQIPGALAQACRAGAGWTWDGVGFELLHPARAGLAGNASSCVLRVATPGASLLLPGDIEAGVEGELAADQAEDLRSTILVAAHHGSATSTSARFLAAVAPRFVLYSTGYANRFGFPAAKVRKRVSKLGAAELDTADAGAIGFRLHAGGIDAPSLFRREHRRLWSHAVAETEGAPPSAR